MTIDIEGLSQEELVDLNHRIVERLRFLAHARAHASMLEFRIGDRVTFTPEGQPPVVGILTKYNRKESQRMREFFEWGNQYELDRLAGYFAGRP
jgi:hypothetical protein